MQYCAISSHVTRFGPGSMLCTFYAGATFLAVNGSILLTAHLSQQIDDVWKISLELEKGWDGGTGASPHNNAVLMLPLC